MRRFSDGEYPPWLEIQSLPYGLWCFLNLWKSSGRLCDQSWCMILDSTVIVFEVVFSTRTRGNAKVIQEHVWETKLLEWACSKTNCPRITSYNISISIAVNKYGMDLGGFLESSCFPPVGRVWLDLQNHSTWQGQTIGILYQVQHSSTTKHLASYIPWRYLCFVFFITRVVIQSRSRHHIPSWCSE